MCELQRAVWSPWRLTYGTGHPQSVCPSGCTHTVPSGTLAQTGVYKHPCMPAYLFTSLAIISRKGGCVVFLWENVPKRVRKGMPASSGGACLSSCTLSVISLPEEQRIRRSREKAGGLVPTQELTHLQQATLTLSNAGSQWRGTFYLQILLDQKSWTFALSQPAGRS